MTNRQIVFVAIASALGLSVASGAWAQNDPMFNASGFQPNRDYVTPTSFGPGLNATEHVDPVSGSLILTFTDLVLPGNGGRDLVFQRTYNSKGAFGGAPGQWSFGIAGIPLWVEDTWPNTPDFHPVLHTADGGGSSAATNLYEPAQGQAIRMTDRFWKYYRNSRIAWLPDGTVVNFDTNLRLSSVVDPFGNTILSLVYSSNGETVTVTQSLGAGQERVITVELPPDCVMGKPACVPTSMSYAGRSWTYIGGGYELSTVTPPVGSPWQYGYGGDSSVRTMSVITPHGGSVLYTIQNLGFPWTNGETYYTNVVTARQASDVRGGQSSGTWSFDYDWETASLAKSSVVTAPDGTRTRYNYGFWPGLIENNGAALYPGRLYLVNQRKTWQGSTEPECSDALECETRQYDWLPIPSAGVETLPALMNRTIIRGGRTYSTSYAYSGNNYDDFHNPSTITESGDLSRTIVRTYAHSANAPANAPYIIAKLTSESVTVNGETFTRLWGYDGCAPGHPGGCSLSAGFLSAESIYGITTSFTNDGRGNVATATKANGKATSFSYSNGRVSRVTTPGVVTDMQINPDGTVASTTVAGRTTGFTYDDVGRQLTAAANGKYSVVNAYDNGAGAFVTTTRGPSSVTTWVDGFGRPIDTLDSVNVRTNIHYDAAGRTTYRSLPYVEGQGAGNVGTHYVYDGLGRIKVETFATGHSRTYEYVGNVVRVRDEEGRTTEIVRSGFGHPDDAVVTSVTDADNKTWTYTYNAVGSLRTMSGSGVTRTWNYDSQNRLVSETHPESGTTTYPLYDAAGVLKRKVDANGTVTNYGHDGNDRLTSIQAGTEITTIGYENGSDNRASMSVSGGASTAFQYDLMGNMTRRTDVIDGKEFITEFLYDPSDILRRITYPSGRQVDYGVDSEGRITSVINPNTPSAPYAPSITPHPLGAIASYRAGNNLVTDTTFNSRYWVNTIGVGAMFLSYTYDNTGNVTAIEDSRPGMNQTFTYDALDRLRTANSASFTMQFAYDPHGNRQSANGTTYTYHPGNPFRLQSVTGGPSAMQYDLNGNMTSASGITMSYTPGNLLQASSVSGGAQVSYAYDADMWRVKKQITGSATTYYLRDPGGRLLTEWQNSSPNATVKDYIYAGSRLIAVHTSTSLPQK